MPVRGIKKSYRSVTGYFMSRKNNRQLAFESTLEHDFFLVLEFDPLVIGFEEQPFKLRFHCNDTYRYYVPDCLVHYHNTSSVYEVKYQAEIDKDEELRQKLACIKIHIEGEGKYLFYIFTNLTASQIYIQNLKFLYKFTFLKNTAFHDNRFRKLYETLSSDISIHDFLNHIDADSNTKRTILPYFWYFVSLHPEMIDLNQKLSMTSYIVAGIKWQK